jgi:hypothetical protein
MMIAHSPNITIVFNDMVSLNIIHPITVKHVTPTVNPIIRLGQI